MLLVRSPHAFGSAYDILYLNILQNKGHTCPCKAVCFSTRHSNTMQGMCYTISTTSIWFSKTVKKFLQYLPPALHELIELAWEFITLPNPLTICQPAHFAERTHECQFDYWDPSKPNAEMIYLRPARVLLQTLRQKFEYGYISSALHYAGLK